MYHKICALFPNDVWNFTTIPKARMFNSDCLREDDVNANGQFQNYDPDYCNYPFHCEHYGLIHIPMRKGWWDLIDLTTCTQPIEDPYVKAIDGVHWNYLQHLLDGGPPEVEDEVIERFIISAAKHGYLSLLQELHSQGIYDQYFTRRAIDCAVGTNQLAVFKFLQPIVHDVPVGARYDGIFSL
jgi:hypothetical protein